MVLNPDDPRYADDALGYHNAEPPDCQCGHGPSYHLQGRCCWRYPNGDVCGCRERREDHD